MAVVCSVAVAVLVSWSFHVTVEMPVQNFGKKVTNSLRLKRRDAVQAASAAA